MMNVPKAIVKRMHRSLHVSGLLREAIQSIKANCFNHARSSSPLACCSSRPLLSAAALLSLPSASAACRACASRAASAAATAVASADSFSARTVEPRQHSNDSQADNLIIQQ